MDFIDVLIYGTSIHHLLGKEAIRLDPTISGRPVRYYNSLCTSLKLARIMKTIPAERKFHLIVLGHGSLHMDEEEDPLETLRDSMNALTELFDHVVLVATPEVYGPYGKTPLAAEVNMVLENVARQHSGTTCFWKPPLLNELKPPAKEKSEKLNHGEINQQISETIHKTLMTRIIRVLSRTTTPKSSSKKTAS